MKYILLSIISVSFMMADIYISGDARIRPRYDIKENSDGSSTSDLYYLYRARLNMKADIGDGWFFSTKLGANGLAGMTKMGDDFTDAFVYGSGNINSIRPVVQFNELYFGGMNDKWGFWGGAFPLKSNPALDIHFYSDKLVDIPFIVYNNSSITGFAGYETIMGKKLNWFLSVDNNVVEKEEFSDETEAIEDGDNYTLGMDMFLNFGSISINPRIMTSSGGTEDDIYPMTYGGDLFLPKLAGFSSSLSYYLSTQGKESDEQHYEADHMRVSLSKSIKNGKLKFFYDMASKNSDAVSFMWFSYTYNLYKSEMGEVTISPTLRLQNGKNAGSSDYDKEFSRAKFELTAQIKFK